MISLFNIYKNGKIYKILLIFDEKLLYLTLIFIAIYSTLASKLVSIFIRIPKWERGIVIL